MNKIKLTSALMLSGFAMTVCVQAADTPTSAPSSPKPTTATAKAGAIPPASSKQGLSFDKDVKPLFEASCTRCHGAQRPKAGLRLTSLEDVLKGSEDGKVITAGDSAKSKLVTAIARINPKTAMPPEPRASRRPGGPAGERGEHGGPGRGPAGPPAKPLTAEEVGIVRAWIDQGAK